MRRQTFRLRQPHDSGANRRQIRRGVRNQAGGFPEGVRIQNRCVARCPAGRQHMARTGEIVAEWLRRISTEEYGAGMPYARQQGLRRLRQDFQMLRRGGIHAFRRLVKIANQQNQALALQRRLRGRCPR